MKATTCAIDGKPCKDHAGVVHGAEAEELRSGIERIRARNYDDVGELSDALLRLLDSVDARDSLALLEAVDARNGGAQ